MAVVILILVIMAALLAIVSGVWVATGLVKAVFAGRAAPAEGASRTKDQ